MIEYLSGKIVRRHLNGIILDVNGVGYGLEIPLSALVDLPANQEPLNLHVFTRVREDSLKLYGFLTFEDRSVFEILININGVGPKVALAIMSTLTVSQLKNAIESMRIDMLESVPGIGKRTAEKILVELKSKIDRLPDSSSHFSSVASNTSNHQQGQVGSSESEVFDDLRSAMSNLGYKKKDIDPVLNNLSKEASGQPFSQLLKDALALIVMPAKPSKSNASNLDELF